MSRKIFVHRVFSKAKSLAAEPHVEESVSVLVKSPELDATAAEAKRARMLERAKIHAAVREATPQIKPTLQAIKRGLMKLLSTEICRSEAYFEGLVQNGKTVPEATAELGRLIGHFLDGQHHCLVCGRIFDAHVKLWPSLIATALPVWPSKKAKLEPITLCQDCSQLQEDNDMVESILFAYATLADPRIEFAEDMPSVVKWRAAIRLHARGINVIDPALQR